MKIRKIWATWAILFLFPFSSAHAEWRPIGAGIEPIYLRWLSAKSACDRPGPWTSGKNAACNKWYAVTDEMQRNGWCYGGTAAREPWHICTIGDQQSVAAQNAEMARAAELDRQEAIETKQMSSSDRALYHLWSKSYGPCRDRERGSSCASVERSYKILNSHGWCHFSPLSAVDERWHRCRRGDIN